MPQARLRHRRVGHDELVADDAERDGVLDGVQGLENRQEPFGVPADQRMVGRVELGRAHAGGEAPQQLVVVSDRVCSSDSRIQSISTESRSRVRPSSYAGNLVLCDVR